MFMATTSHGEHSASAVFPFGNYSWPVSINMMTAIVSMIGFSIGLVNDVV